MFRPSIQSGKTAGEKRKTKKKIFIYIYMLYIYILEKPTEKIERNHILAGIPK